MYAYSIFYRRRNCSDYYEEGDFINFAFHLSFLTPAALADER